MFDSITGAWSTIIGNPLLGFILLALVSVGIIFMLSGGNWLDSVIGLFRVFFTIFSTPFIFLRDALAIMRTSGEAEQDYARTRVFVMFRGNRILYLLIFLGALLILSGGVTTSLLTLYPKAELDRDRELRTQVAQIETDLQNINQSMSAAAQPGRRENLANARAQALSAYQEQVEGNRAFLQNTEFGDNIIYELANTRDADAVARIRSRLDNYMAGCPPTSRYAFRWQGFTPDNCNRFREFILALAARKEQEHGLQQAYVRAEEALRGAESARQQTDAQRASIQARLQEAKQQRQASSLGGGGWVLAHVLAAASVLLSTLFAFIIYVWIWAVALDFWNWLILMMRSLEKTQAEKLERAATEYQP